MTFDDLSLHPALRAALATRGYETPTTVQAAVLDAGCDGRDLLVSSQTGSGKTIAFGAAMAGALLGPTDTRVAHGKKPIALVIVPTRELAVQVREELRWLFAGVHLRLGSFTGGTPVFGDLKALERGVELVIGTPGRLVDLLRRQRLQLADLKVVVLDEADEMLDLGFRQDLETLLQAAPATRRTLLLSATLPSEIRALARSYQRDALAIDPRKSADGAGAGPGPGKGAHEDITHVAHLIAGGDRLAAVINVLRAEETTRAIVFCTTREGVADMHAALVAARLRRHGDLGRSRPGRARSGARAAAPGRRARAGRDQRRGARPPPARRRPDRPRRPAPQRRLADSPEWAHRPRPVTLAELSVGPLVARDDLERAARQAHLQQAEADFDPLPFDAAAARAFGRVTASLRRRVASRRRGHMTR